jgi:Cft2 family RNA processing exonuclease
VGFAANHKPAEPLFTVADTLKSLESFNRSATYGQPTDLAQGIRATFVDAGHILGSASILLELTEAGRSLRLLFSGDLGNAGHPLLLTPPPRADVVVIETTYGDRLHKPIGASVGELYGAISNTLGRGGNVIILVDFDPLGERAEVIAAVAAAICPHALAGCPGKRFESLWRDVGPAGSIASSALSASRRA